jgi:hypothetical protein
MKIVTRIEKIAGEQDLLDGRVFDSFLSARREMTQRFRARRAERQPQRAGMGASNGPLLLPGSLRWIPISGVHNQRDAPGGRGTLPVNAPRPFRAHRL